MAGMVHAQPSTIPPLLPKIKKNSIYDPTPTPKNLKTPPKIPKKIHQK
jgi:hypothetical protein